MIEIGDKIKVFKDGDAYHKKGEWKKGVVLGKYPNFCLVMIEEKYRESFKESELIKNDKNNEPR